MFTPLYLHRIHKGRGAEKRQVSYSDRNRVSPLSNPSEPDNTKQTPTMYLCFVQPAPGPAGGLPSPRAWAPPCPRPPLQTPPGWGLEPPSGPSSGRRQSEGLCHTTGAGTGKRDGKGDVNTQNMFFITHLIHRDKDCIILHVGWYGSTERRSEITVLVPAALCAISFTKLDHSLNSQ